MKTICEESNEMKEGEWNAHARQSTVLPKGTSNRNKNSNMKFNENNLPLRTRHLKSNAIMHIWSLYSLYTAQISISFAWVSIFCYFFSACQYLSLWILLMFVLYMLPYTTCELVYTNVKRVRQTKDDQWITKLIHKKPHPSRRFFHPSHLKHICLCDNNNLYANEPIIHHRCERNATRSSISVCFANNIKSKLRYQSHMQEAMNAPHIAGKSTHYIPTAK